MASGTNTTLTPADTAALEGALLLMARALGAE